MFLPNQKVVCCDADIHESLLCYVQPLIKDQTYTIRDVVMGANPKGGEGIEVAVYLHEITNTVNEFGIERGYNAERFAPLNPPEEVYEDAYADKDLVLTY